MKMAGRALAGLWERIAKHERLVPSFHNPNSATNLPTEHSSPTGFFVYPALISRFNPGLPIARRLSTNFIANQPIHYTQGGRTNESSVRGRNAGCVRVVRNRLCNCLRSGGTPCCLGKSGRWRVWLCLLIFQRQGR